MFSQITASLTLSFTIPSHSKALSSLDLFNSAQRHLDVKKWKSFMGMSMEMFDFQTKAGIFPESLSVSTNVSHKRADQVTSSLCSCCSMSSGWDDLSHKPRQVKKPLHPVYVLPWRQPKSMGTCQSQSIGGWLRGTPQHFILIQELPFSRPYLLTTQICIVLGGICFKQYNPSKHEFPSIIA